MDLIPSSVSTNALSLTINNLLPILQKSKNLSDRAIGSSLWGLGKLAKKKFLTHVNADVILRLIKKLGMGDPNAQEIGNSIWGVGRLASLLTEHPIPDEDILALLYKLLKKEKELIAQNISMSVNGIRNLAESDLLVLKNTENLYYVIWYLCEKLTALDPIPEEIVSTIDGLEAVATLAESLTENHLRS